MFFKRLSRGSRSNSYAENDYQESSPRSLNNHSSADHYLQPSDRGAIHDSPRGSGTPQHNSFPPTSPTKESQRPDSSRGSANMYASQRSQAPSDPYSRVNALNGGGIPSGSGNRASMQLDGDLKSGGAPDLLTRAFNEAVRPYTDKIGRAHV